jgi:hypothetical protein
MKYLIIISTFILAIADGPRPLRKLEIEVRIAPEFRSDLKGRQIEVVSAYGRHSITISDPTALTISIDSIWRDSVSVFLETYVPLDGVDASKNFVQSLWLGLSKDSITRISIDFPEKCHYNVNFKSKTCPSPTWYCERDNFEF